MPGNGIAGPTEGTGLLLNAKYETDYRPEFLDPAVNATIRVKPRWAFGLVQEDFGGSPTRWVFDS